MRSSAWCSSEVLHGSSVVWCACSDGAARSIRGSVWYRYGEKAAIDRGAECNVVQRAVCTGLCSVQRMWMQRAVCVQRGVCRAGLYLCQQPGHLLVLSSLLQLWCASWVLLEAFVTLRCQTLGGWAAECTRYTAVQCDAEVWANSDYCG